MYATLLNVQAHTLDVVLVLRLNASPVCLEAVTLDLLLLPPLALLLLASALPLATLLPPLAFGLDAVTMAYVDYLYVIADEAGKAAK